MAYNHHRKSTSSAKFSGMIPKKEFVQLRKRILERLKRCQEQNGYNHLSHDSLDSPLTYGMDIYPFRGMQKTIRATAITRFWDALVNAKHVERHEFEFDGRTYIDYCLTGTSRLPEGAPDPAKMVPAAFKVACLKQMDEALEKMKNACNAGEESVDSAE